MVSGTGYPNQMHPISDDFVDDVLIFSAVAAMTEIV